MATSLENFLSTLPFSFKKKEKVLISSLETLLAAAISIVELISPLKNIPCGKSETNLFSTDSKISFFIFLKGSSGNLFGLEFSNKFQYSKILVS